MKILELPEMLSFVMIEACIEHLKRQNVSSASHHERINKLVKIRDEFVENAVEKFLSEDK